jgi:glycosyltransferase involved in cell wall biosynthesis
MTVQNRISVAMCTYNGERFLAAQLASIAKQTRLPDELVVHDDKSSDNTVAILQEFAQSARFPVRIIENPRNLGYVQNFEAAIRNCDADLIALADQDDVWYPTRLERSELELNTYPKAGLVFSDADLVDDHDRLLGETLWHRLGFLGKRKRDLQSGRFVVLAKHRFATGATMMLRASLRDRCLPIGSGWIHDEWIIMIAAAFSEVRPVDQPLIRYRIHGSQQVGLSNKLVRHARGTTRAEKHWSRVADSAQELQQLCDALSAMTLDTEPEVLPAYRRHLQFLLFRSNLPAPRLARLGSIFSWYSGYQAHASGLASVLKDLAFARRAK